MAHRRKKKAASDVKPITMDQASIPETHAPLHPVSSAPITDQSLLSTDKITDQHQPVQPEPVPESGVSRRAFLTNSGALLATACGLGVIAGATRFSIPDTTVGAVVRFALGMPADFKVRTVTWLRERELFVIHDDRGFGAFSSKCTHLGCTVRRTADGFTCPCHGARYDANGKVVSGPARRALDWFQLWQEPDGQIWVDTSRLVAIGTGPLKAADKD